MNKFPNNYSFDEGRVKLITWLTLSTEMSQLTRDLYTVQH